jgi:hypothetical protein
MRTRALRDHRYNLRALEFQAAMQASDEITSETPSLATPMFDNQVDEEDRRGMT